MKSNKLFTTIVIAALTATFGGGAFANDQWLGNRGDNWLEHVSSTKTRAEVRAELEQARAQGMLIGGQEPNYPAQPAFKSTRTREEVRAEVVEAAKNPVRNLDYIGG
ncbi:DUF4148 domain-containing protein [Herbaspirillum sp. HC18]|nr:DUF4148 domain-containing protein [Herbaspirillum sp. HC18]